ncbi:putative leucine-rich repeat protein [Blattamonas nauphoetae]|uniref:Leucine-rich repeat protein n=1 Tax=Blattamonas nauphoetae TaxID=2049346 RepID=A0ABQ9XTN6_9EUKA|nr:putative leucine-rich repeat protein [Blattamonas nauphoetae]
MKSVSLKYNLVSSHQKTLLKSTIQDIPLAYNLLTDLLDGLFTLPNLQTLYVSFNPIAIIQPSISQLTSLVKVNFGFNKIKEVPNELFRLPTLTHLILSHNKLTSLPSDPAMSPKVELSLGFVDPLSNSMIYEKTETGTHPGAVLCALERLLLVSNQLTSVPPLVSRFRNFLTLSLAGNGISELPRHFFRSLPNLSRLDLSIGELTHLPESIVAVSPPAILRNMHSTHTPTSSTLASPIALSLVGSGSRPYGFRRGMESPRWQFGHLNVSLNELGECVGGVDSGMESIVSSVLSEWEEEMSEPFALNLPHPSDVATEPFLLPLLWKNRVYRSLMFLSTCGSLGMDVEWEGRMETGLNRPPWSQHTTLRDKKEEKEEKEKEEWEEMVRVSEAEHKRQIVHVGNHIRAFLRSLSDERTDQNTKKEGKPEQGNDGEARTPSHQHSPSPHSSMVGGSECNDRRFSGSVLFSDGLSRDEQMESLRRVGRTATVAQVSSTELEQTLLSMETESQRMMWSAEFVNPVFATNDFVPIEIEFVGENEGEEAVCEECFPNDPHAVSMCPPVIPDDTPTSSSLPTRSSDLPPSLLTAEEEGREEEEARKNEEEFAVPTIRRKTEIGSVGKRKTSKDDLDLILKRRKSRNGIQSQHPLITHPITSSAEAMESWEVDLSMEETLGEVSEVSMDGQLVDGKRRTEWSEEEAVLGWGKWSDGVGMDPSLLRPSTHLSTEATKAIVSKVSTEDTVEKEEPAKSDSPIPVLSRKMVFVNNAAGQRRRQDSPDRRNTKLFKEPSTPVYSSLVWKKKWLDETRGMGGEREGRGKERGGDEDEKGMGGSGVDPTKMFLGMSSKDVELYELADVDAALTQLNITNGEAVLISRTIKMKVQITQIMLVKHES